MNVAIGPKSDLRVAGIVESLRRLAPGFDFVDWEPERPAAQQDIPVLLTLSAATRADMEALPNLQLVQTLMDGYESVDIPAATSLGVWVSYVPAQESGNADSVAEMATLLLLAAARRLNLATDAMHAGKPTPAYSPVSLLGKTVCIVGVGNVGQHVAQRLLGFGVRVCGVDRAPLLAPKQIPTRPLSELREALKEADFVVVAVRATAENRHMFDADTIAAMKPGAILVNVARGSLVDSDALLKAVQSGHLGGAGLDVTEGDPVRPGDPLLSCPQIFITPHIAGNTDLTTAGTSEYVADVLKQFASGKTFASLLNKPQNPRKVFS